MAHIPNVIPKRTADGIQRVLHSVKPQAPASVGLETWATAHLKTPFCTKSGKLVRSGLWRSMFQAASGAMALRSGAIAPSKPHRDGMTYMRGFKFGFVV